jgi:mannose-6-phosphate isomerase
MLYPLKFNPIYKEKIWGGNKLKSVLNKDCQENKNTGESWELSAVQENISVVSNGFLAENDIEELIEVYMGDLVGEKVYEKFGLELPLLFKFIDAKDDLSIQVHPNDAFAKEKHKAYGKTEMWYVIDAEKDSKLTIGFNKESDQEEFIQKIQSEDIQSILNIEEAHQEDVFLVPSGTVHSIGKGILLAEIQQTSDISYRIHDYNRKEEDGNLRELHNEFAKDAINYSYEKKKRTDYKKEINKPVLLSKCDYFTSNIISFNKEIERDYIDIDSFVVYMCTEGEFFIDYQKDEPIKISKGETVLIPAALDMIALIPSKNTTIIETYIN